jgi:acyl-CoA dehydrogenase
VVLAFDHTERAPCQSRGGIIPVFSPLVNEMSVTNRGPATAARRQLQNHSFQCYVRPVDETGPALLDALSGGLEATPKGSLSEVWSAYARNRARGATPFVAAVHVASQADRLGFAFAVGYPAALQHMVPGVELPCALCVTEAEGNHPRAIRTTLEPTTDGFVLEGSKSFVTFGTMAAALIIVARVGDRADGRPDLAVVRIPADRTGIELHERPATPFAPEVPHARLTLHQVEVREEERLPGDGYLGYVKPFRTIEDIHVVGAAIGYLVGVARRSGAPAEVLAELGAALAALDRLSLEAPLDPRVHVALHGVYRRLIEATKSDDFAQLWLSAPEDERARWERDQALLRVASKARDARFRRALEQLG